MWRYGILIVDKDLWNRELRDRHHAGRVTEVKSRSEFPRPVHCVEEASDYSSPSFFLDELKPRPTSQEFFEAQAFAVRDHIVVGKNHKAGCKINASVDVRGDKNFCAECFETLPPLPDFRYVDGAYPFVQPGQINAVYDSSRRIGASIVVTTVFKYTVHRVFTVIDVHLKDAREFLLEISRW